ncbi:MAG TPA: hypothetical protein VFS58_16170 [Steroidobacteraceae bacterium]|nr:hypothetical protein [Steroidobacteraceae bacterium]
MKQKLLWLVFALHSGAAWAARDGVIIGQDFIPTISVESTNGQSYNKVRGPTGALNIQISGQCPSNHGVYRASARALHWPDSTGEADIGDLRKTDRKLSRRLVWVPHSLTPIEWHTSWKQKAIAACNANLAKQKSDGRTTGQVFAQRWPLSKVEVDRVEGTLSCLKLESGGKGAHFDADGGKTFTMLNSAWVNINCERHMVNDFKAEPKPNTSVNDLTYGVHVVQANLSALPKTTANGVCGLTLSGVIETDAINATVTLFYRNNKGGTTPWRTVKTDHSKVAFFSDFLDFTKPTGPSMSAAQPAGSGGIATNPGKQHNGWYQMVGKNIKFQSNMASFNFDCAKPSPGGITTAPNKPTVPPNKVVPPATPPPPKKGLAGQEPTPLPFLLPAVQAAPEAPSRGK